MNDNEDFVVAKQVAKEVAFQAIMKDAPKFKLEVTCITGEYGEDEITHNFHNILACGIRDGFFVVHQGDGAEFGIPSTKVISYSKVRI